MHTPVLGLGKMWNTGEGEFGFSPGSVLSPWNLVTRSGRVTFAFSPLTVQVTPGLKFWKNCFLNLKCRSSGMELLWSKEFVPLWLPQCWPKEAKLGAPSVIWTDVTSDSRGEGEEWLILALSLRLPVLKEKK